MIKQQILKAEENGNKFVVVYAGEEMKLDKLFDTSVHIPVFIFSINKKQLKARCYQPEVVMKISLISANTKSVLNSGVLN